MYRIGTCILGVESVPAVYDGSGRLVGWFPTREVAERVAELLESADTPMPSADLVAE